MTHSEITKFKTKARNHRESATVELLKISNDLQVVLHGYEKSAQFSTIAGESSIEAIDGQATISKLLLEVQRLQARLAQAEKFGSIQATSFTIGSLVRNL